MKKQIALLVDQMKYLKELGIDTSDASMEWYDDGLGRHLGAIEGKYCSSPAYTLQDLLDKLPKKIHTEDKNFRECRLEFHPCEYHYMGVYSNTSNGHILFDWIIDTNPLTVAYKLFVWGIRNNHIKINKI